MAYNFDEIGTRSTVAVSVFLLSLSSLFTLIHIKNHCISLKYAEAQILILALALTPSVIGWCSWITIVLGPDWAQLDLIGISYMSIAALSFFYYTLKLFGWEANPGFNVYRYGKIQHRLISLGSIKSVFIWMGSMRIGNCSEAMGYLNLVKLGVFQFAFVLAGIGIAGVIIQFADSELMDYGNPDIYHAWLWLRVAEAASALIAFLVLHSWKQTMKRIEDLSKLKIDSKFQVIAWCLLLPSIQPIPMALLSKYGIIADSDANSVKEVTVFTHNFLLIIEMIAAGILQVVSFQPEEFYVEEVSTELEDKNENKYLEETTPNVTLRIMD
ncbi:unnamed protein product [Blepharisma stoltei]|uniref:Gustatory receptor n=1 Tax=Blepharisma stoltei TaxID=1481888 RepID=A0AAU9IYJ1_9CILI|nr:unnamed protein product [Blepharisma stoltei]